MHLGDSGIKRKAGFAHLLPGKPRVLPAVLVCDAASRSVHHPSEACIPQLQTHVRSLSHFIPLPAVLWGKFLQDASCYSLNPVSSLNSIKLGIMKASNDLLIKNCFCRAAHYLQRVFSSLVNTWIFWLRFLSTVVSGNGSCPACASPQKCWLSSSQVLATQIYRRQFNCTRLSEGVIWSLRLATRQQGACTWLRVETGYSRRTIH